MADGKFDGETSSGDYVICPHCGYSHGEAYEYEAGKNECDDCERTFRLSIDYEVTYSTEQLPAEPKPEETA